MRVFLHSRTFLPRLGGLEQATLLLAQGLAARGHHVDVVTDVEADAPDEHVFAVHRAQSWTVMAELAGRADVVHANGFSLTTLALAESAGRPLVWTHANLAASCLEGLGIHDNERCNGDVMSCTRLTARDGGWARAARQLARFGAGRASLPAAAANVAVSGFIARAVDAPRSVVIPNAADSTTYKPDARTDRVRTRLLFMGRLVSIKGVDLLLDALAHARRAGRTLELDVVGAGPEEGALRRRAADHGIEAQVRWRGVLRGTALREAIWESAAVVVPSTWDEAFGLVAAEAMLCGRAVLASDRGALPEVVQHPECIFGSDQPEALAALAWRAVTDLAWRGEAERRALAVAREYTVDVHVARYVALYKRVLGGPLPMSGISTAELGA